MLKILDSDAVNLVVVAGYNDVNKSNDREEIAEIEKMHDLMKQYNLNGQFRWMSAQMNSTATLLMHEEHLCKYVAL
ncbi:hypothetical protein C5167_016719 [Papaver somniferum]|nr:hypothetical protein C5167_016719 [Papaver somniferum]